MLNVFPDISPDGKRVVFARSTPSSNGMYDLFVINIDGTGLTQLTNSPNFSENRPSWSPDGGSVVFDGIHHSGHESEAPALQAGELPNYNIYLMVLPPANTVTPKTKLSDPPVVAVIKRTVRMTLAPFLKAQLATGVRGIERKTAVKAVPKARISFKYDIEINKTGKQKARINLLAKKNSVTAKNLKPGNYNVRYRVQITSKAGTKPAVIKNTKFSPRAAFKIAS